MKKSKEKITFRQKFINMKEAVQMELREHKSSFLVYVILRLLVIIVMVLQLFNGNYENVFLCILTLLLLIVPSFLQVNLRVEIPTPLEITILLFIFAAEILGEIRAFYVIYPFWDSMLHTLNGFLAAAIGFSLVDILNRDERFAVNLSPAFVAIVSFCFSMTIGVLWEFFECGMDLFFGLDMQKDTVIHTIKSVMLDPTGGNHPTGIQNIKEVIVNSQELGLGGYLDIGLLDTMKDMFVNFIGAVVFSFIGYFYVKKRGQGKFAKEFIPTIKADEADFLTMIEEENQKKMEQDMSRKIKTIIFDIGNVLTDFRYEEFFRENVADEEKIAKLIKATVKSKMWQELDRGVLTEAEILEGFLENDRSIEAEIKIIFENMNGILRQRSYAIPWIKKLKERGYQVLYLSNFPHKMVRECPDAISFIEETDGGILSYREHLIKPDPAIYKLLMERFDLNAEECVFIDDSKNNIQASVQLGIHGIVFTTKEEVDKELEALLV